MWDYFLIRCNESWSFVLPVRVPLRPLSLVGDRSVQKSFPPLLVHLLLAPGGGELFGDSFLVFLSWPFLCFPQIPLKGISASATLKSTWPIIPSAFSLLVQQVVGLVFLLLMSASNKNYRKVCGKLCVRYIINSVSAFINTCCVGKYIQTCLCTQTPLSLLGNSI